MTDPALRHACANRPWRQSFWCENPDAETLLLTRMDSVSLASIADDFRRRREAAGAAGKDIIPAV